MATVLLCLYLDGMPEPHGFALLGMLTVILACVVYDTLWIGYIIRWLTKEVP